MVEEGPGGLEGPGEDLSTRDGLLRLAATAPKDLLVIPARTLLSSFSSSSAPWTRVSTCLRLRLVVVITGGALSHGPAHSACSYFENAVANSNRWAHRAAPSSPGSSPRSTSMPSAHAGTCSQGKLFPARRCETLLGTPPCTPQKTAVVCPLIRRPHRRPWAPRYGRAS